MEEIFKGRFSGTRPKQLDRVIQELFRGQAAMARVEINTIRDWITSGAVEVDGHVKRQIDSDIQPGSFVTLRYILK